MRGIQIAKEMAQQELSCQKSEYEEKIKALEAELVSFQRLVIILISFLNVITLERYITIIGKIIFRS